MMRQWRADSSRQLLTEFGFERISIRGTIARPLDLIQRKLTSGIYRDDYTLRDFPAKERQVEEAADFSHCCLLQFENHEKFST